MDGERDPYEAYTAIQDELRLYGAKLEERPQIVVASKMDADGAEERKAEFEKKLGFKVIGLSALTEEGITPLMKKAYELISKTEPFPIYIEESDEVGGMKVYDAHKDDKEREFVILHPKDHLFVITGEKVTKEYGLYNLSSDQGVSRLIAYLNRIGIDEALLEKGAVDGDTVQLCDFTFEFIQ